VEEHAVGGLACVAGEASATVLGDLGAGGGVDSVGAGIVT
jgi:hypothetical protein